MNEIIKDIYVKRKDLPVVIHYVQETNAIPIIFRIADWKIPSGSLATIYVKKPSGKEVYNDLAMNLGDNTVTVVPTTQMVAEEGKNKCQLQIIANGKVLNTFPMILDVTKKIISDDAIESTDEYHALQLVLGMAESAVNTALEMQEQLYESTEESREISSMARVAADNADAAAEEAMLAVERADKAASDAYKAIDNLVEGGGGGATGEQIQQIEKNKNDIERLSQEIDNKQPKGNYLTEHQDISGKADKATTLNGYGITDGVTKTQFDDLSQEVKDIGTIKTVTGTSATVTDAIDGKVISCVGESDVTVSGINICSVKELSGVGNAVGSFGTMIPAGTYTLTAEITTNNPNITKARVFIGAFPKNIVCDGTRQSATYNITRDIDATLNVYASDSTTVTEYSISLSNIVITKGSSPSEYEPYFEPVTYSVDNLNSIELTENTNIITSDSGFELRYVQRNAYVESLLSSIDIGTKMYVTPENFGAYGDGFADDTSALNTCISYAVENSIPVRGYGKYKTTSPINIIGNKVDLHIYQIDYLGNDSAVVYQGLNSFITIQKITSKGTGLYIKAETSNTYYNTFTVNEITAEKNGVHVYAIKNAYQNQLYFNIIKSKGEYSCILFERDKNTDNGYCTEWTIKGGYLMGGLWGIRGWMSNSTAIDVHTENLGTDGNGGAIFSDNGQIPKIIWARSGEIILHNTWLKLSGIFAKPQTVQINRILTTLEAIDISELEVDADVETRSDNIQAFTEIEVQTEKQSNVLLTKNLILWGNRFQFPPVRYIRLDVVSDIDMTPQYYKDGIPQCFVAKADATINLHPTYAANCLNTFEIVQEEGHKLTVKDYVGNVVFDGTQYNDGRYRLTAYVSGDVPLQYDMGNQLWEILEL